MKQKELALLQASRAIPGWGWPTRHTHTHTRAHVDGDALGILPGWMITEHTTHRGKPWDRGPSSQVLQGCPTCSEALTGVTVGTRPSGSQVYVVWKVKMYRRNKNRSSQKDSVPAQVSKPALCAIWYCWLPAENITGSTALLMLASATL